jgi:uncharacterized phiE125 gp8 family phage protein
MTWTVAAIDYQVLPSAMLTLAKQHMRIDFVDDDALVASCLRRGISLLERYSGLSVFPARIDWQPFAADAVPVAAYQCPLQPVAGFSVTADGTDVSSQYELRLTSPISPVWLANKANEPFPAGTRTELRVGWADINTLPPAIEDGILRLSATLYEYRETVTNFSLDPVPQWANDLLVGMWIPRA